MTRISVEEELFIPRMALSMAGFQQRIQFVLFSFVALINNPVRVYLQIVRLRSQIYLDYDLVTAFKAIPMREATLSDLEKFEAKEED